MTALLREQRPVLGDTCHRAGARNGQQADPDDGRLAERLLVWYRAQHRDLPWRRGRDPYGIWVSEVMLQQTQVRTVIPYYERFMARFPTVDALAEATLDAVLALWQGLGYYARARGLHAAARIVRGSHAGIVPSEYSAFRALPGVGDYIAAAVLSIGFGQDLVAIDGNVTRVLCRVHNIADDVSRSAGRRRVREHAEAMLTRGCAGEFNEAMMELGATLCSAAAPRCTVCPLELDCVARLQGLQASRPLSRQRSPPPERPFVAAVIWQEKRLLIVRRRPEGLLGGLWELPGGELVAGEAHVMGLSRLLRQGLGVQAQVGAQLTTIRHAYTHFRPVVRVFHASIQGQPIPAEGWDGCHWLASHELGQLGLTGVTTRILAHLDGWGGIHRTSG